MEIIYDKKELGTKIKEYRAKGCWKYNMVGFNLKSLPSIYNLIEKGIILDYNQQEEMLNIKPNG